MQIENENIMQREKKGPKAVTIIAILIAVTLIAVIVIILLILSRQGKKFSVVIDGKVANVTADTFVFTNDGKMYISIRDIAPYVGYEAHEGEYKVDIKDPDKIYVEASDATETASFYLNSTTISKVAPNSNEDYENITIKEPVIRMNDKMQMIALDENFKAGNDKMYVSDEGFTVGFNSLISYNKEKNQVTIYTLPKLFESYSAKIQNYGYSKMSEDFNNKKTLVYGMIVASKESTGKLGVIDTEGNEILNPRYNKIKFIESSKEFIVTNSSDKVGITDINGKTKITVSYDEIKVMDSKLGLYLVNSNKKFGVIDSSERSIIYIEYDQIGVDTSKFPNDNIKNQYVLYNKIIPAKINGKWRLFDVQGNRITDLEFDQVGFISGNSSDKVNGNALTIGDTNTIVVGKDGLYGAVDVRGNVLIPIKFEKIYSTTSAGKTNYYILHGGKDYSAIDYIDVMKKQLGYDKENEEDTEKPIKLDNSQNTLNQDRNTIGNEIVRDEMSNNISNNITNSVQTSTNVVDTNTVNAINGTKITNDIYMVQNTL